MSDLWYRPGVGDTCQVCGKVAEPGHCHPHVDNETGKPSPEAVAALKANWVGDPCWDIEDTEGFQACHDELLAFHKLMDERWDAMLKQQKSEFAQTCGAFDNTDLAGYLWHIEERLSKLAGKIEELESKCLPMP